jgi:hypothetical protein
MQAQKQPEIFISKISIINEVTGTLTYGISGCDFTIFRASARSWSISVRILFNRILLAGLFQTNQRSLRRYKTVVISVAGLVRDEV